MKIAIDDIKASPKELSYTEEVDELNSQLAHGVRDYRIPTGPTVDVEYYRSGLDVFFRGALHGQVVGTCARCLEDYAFGLDHPFVFVLTPRAGGVNQGTRLSAEDMALSYYEGDEIDLEQLIREQLYLALPMKPLCRDDCRGLCPQCGTNLNTGSCDCAPVWEDPRLAPLKNLLR
jgi:uncharacterized protein